MLDYFICPIKHTKNIAEIFSFFTPQHATMVTKLSWQNFDSSKASFSIIADKVGFKLDIDGILSHEEACWI